MLKLIMLILTLHVTACASEQAATVRPTIEMNDGRTVTLDAVCDGLRKPLNDLVDIVVSEGTDAVVIATETVIVKYDKGCPAS